MSLNNVECLQEFLISLNVELRGVTMLSRASFVAILEKMFKGAAPDELPQPPEPLTEDFKKRQEKAARVRYSEGVSQDRRVADYRFVTESAVLVVSPPTTRF